MTRLLTVFLLPLFYFISASTVGAITRVPLKKKKRDLSTQRQLSLDILPYSAQGHPTLYAEQYSNLDNEKETRVAVRDYRNVQYFGTIKVGGQGFNVIFDTGSSDLWVTARRCGFLRCGILHPRYYSSKSRTYQKNGKPFIINYLQGSVSGVYSVDDVRIGSLVAKGQNFAEVTNTVGLGFQFRFAIYDGVSTMMLLEPTNQLFMFCMKCVRRWRGDTTCHVQTILFCRLFCCIRVVLIELFILCPLNRSWVWHFKMLLLDLFLQYSRPSWIKAKLKRRCLLSIFRILVVNMVNWF